MTVSTRVIGTHDGAFHCDEALAVYLLRQTAAYRDATVLRTRDEEKLASADVVVDVGGKYDHAENRYDHHQRSFTEHFSPSHKATKLSSAGLVYRHFGREVLETLLGRANLGGDVELLYQRVYNSFIEAVDAVDNGVSIIEGGPPRYRNNTDLSSRVGHLNVPWNAPADSKESEQARNFEKAVALTGGEFTDAVLRAAKQWLPAREVVKRAWEQRVDDVVVMREFAPWKEHLFDIDDGKTMYIVYEDLTRSGWRIQCVPVAPGSFQSRRPLPESWRGLRDEKLSQVTGVDACVFVHASGFIGGNKSFEGAMEMAAKAREIALAETK